jgi:hypothetical protein
MKPPNPTVEPPSQGTPRPSGVLQFALMAGLLIGALVLLFWKDLWPDYTLFSNDGPLGRISARFSDLPSGIFAVWEDLEWLGGAQPSGMPSVAVMFNTLFGHLMFSKFYAPFAILFLGLSAWFFFRQWKFSPAVCVLGGLAAALNSDFFSTACWGVASQPLSFGLDFLALAALADQSGPRRWIRVVLAGTAVGMAVTDAADIGALFSLFVAAFVIFQALNTEAPQESAPPQPTRTPANCVQGLARLAVLAGFAVLVATSTLTTMIGTQVQGVVGMGQDAASKARRWNEATLWSFPKKETLGVVVPGLFGFRMDTPKGGAYWGAVAQDPAYDRYLEAKKAGKEATPPPPGSLPRFTGGGCYAGVLVVVVALWGIVQSLRRTNGVFSLQERRFIWFWLAGALAALLMAYGRFAPFYKFFYGLPYASIIRSPAKFIHLFSWALIILFGYGLQGLSRLCFEGPAEAQANLRSHWSAWWATAQPWDRNWVRCSVLALVASLGAWLAYATKRGGLVAYLREVGFDAPTSNAIAGFSLRHVGWFILALILSLGLIAVILSGYFKNGRAKWGAALVGLLLAADLAAANLPWVVIYNWKETYVSNPIIDLLREKPYEQRVSVMRVEQFFNLEKFPPQAAPLVQNYSTMCNLYGSEWMQHLFQYFNVQSLDFVQMPRMPVDYSNYETALCTVPLRHWELTNTRYLLGFGIPADQLNQVLDPVRKSFKLLKYFAVVPKPDLVGPPVTYDQMTAVLTEDGPCALYEFGGVLPRARLYTNWQVSTNDDETLKQLASPAFDPAQKVLVASPLPPPAAAKANQPAGTVDVASYAPKQIVLRAKAAAPSVLLLNDRFDPGWKVTLDGKPAELLRCNYIMRGVRVPPGDHEIEFRFSAPLAPFCVSVLGLAVGLGSLLFLGFTRSPEQSQGPEDAARSSKPKLSHPDSQESHASGGA